MTHRLSHTPWILTAVIAGAVLANFAPGEAMAALFVTLEPDHGAPGTVVVGRTGGDGAFAEAVDPLPAFLVSVAAASGVTTADDRDLVAVGQLVVDAAGNGRIAFAVPRLEPGDYALMVFCQSCAPTSAGRTMLEIATFTITPSPPTTDTVNSTPPASSTPVGLVAALIALVAGLVIDHGIGRIRSGRRSQRPRS